jgi:hypothetical protein
MMCAERWERRRWMVASAYTRRQRSRRQMSSKENKKGGHVTERRPIRIHTHGSNFARHLALYVKRYRLARFSSHKGTVTSVTISKP